MVRYYYAGSQRVAVRTGSTLKYLLGDHLGSTTITVSTAGVRNAELRYKAWGENRYTYGSTPTTYRYTGQKQETTLGGAEGLYYYGARWYDPYLGRFIQPDTIVPGAGNPQAWDRYAYARNNPVVYNDPSGHFPWPFFIIGGVALGVIAIPIAYQILTVSPIEEQRAPAPTSYDMTGWLTDRINENATAPVTQAMRENFTSGDPVKIAGATEAWIALVRKNAIWDYKTDIISARITDAKGNIMLCGEQLNFQAVANITYGAIGRSAGVPQWILESGAGAFQIWDNRNDPSVFGPPGTYFDDPYDNWMIRFGCWLFEQYGDQFGKLTKEQLEAAFKEFEKDNGSPGEPKE